MGTGQCKEEKHEDVLIVTSRPDACKENPYKNESWVLASNCWGPSRVITVFFDGNCGLCHRTVQFLVQRDPLGVRFRYAPLQGETAARQLASLDDPPDSVVVCTEDGQILAQGDAAIHIGHALGGGWVLVSVLFSILPRLVRNWLYDWVAKHRYGWFGKTTTACPLLPPEQRDFFLP
jgi:predicted DCC family thiol-disulfide oxidoreductase YuxK